MQHWYKESNRRGRRRDAEERPVLTVLRVPLRPLRLVAPIKDLYRYQWRALPVDYQFVNDPSGRRKILIGWLRVVNSAAIVNFDASSVTPNPGRSFGHSLPSL